ncbi:MAG: glycosyltransferase family 2 protein [Planctomycetia bacterium]|nr:glycosyltransferase family 2 protein [Planctomycetia bacterium]
MVSAIIPAYRAAHTICRAIDSVLAQTEPAKEIIVVDDGSPDDLKSAVARYGGRLRYLHKPNGGVASARNLGIEAATGSVVAFLDADDHWEPCKLACQMDVFRRYPQVGLVASRFYVQTAGDSLCLSRKKVPCDEVLRWQGERAFRLGCSILTGTIAVRRNVLDTHRFIAGLEPAEDRDLWIRLVASTSAYVLSQPLATYVVEPGSLSRCDIDRDCENMLRVVHRNKGLLTNSELRQWESEVFERWAGVLISQRNYRHAFRVAWQRLWRDPWSPVGWWAFTKSGLLSIARVPQAITR